MAIPRKDDFLVKREQKAAESAPGADGSFTYFGPVGVQERFRFLVVREDGDTVSVQPITDAKFKVGLDAWRWKEREGGSPETYLVTKTTPSRVDLKRAQG
jgi:hypothetical protein